MAATATAGYASIPPTGAPAAPVSLSAAMPSSAPTTASPNPAKRALDTVLEAVTAPAALPNLYLDPLNPAADLAPRDRLNLALDSARPWPEFASPAAFALPHAADVKARMAANVELFFWNYFLVASAFATVFALFHLGVAFELAAVAAVAYALFVVAPEEIAVGNRFVVEKKGKAAIVAVATFMVLVFGGGFSFLLAVAAFSALVAAVHAFCHDHQMPTVSNTV